MRRRSTLLPRFALGSESPSTFEPLGSAEVTDQTSSRVRLRCGAATIEVTALAEDVFRVGLFGDGLLVDYRSEAVAKNDWPAFSSHVVVGSNARAVITAEAKVQIGLDPLRIGFRGPRDREFAVDDPALGMGFAPLGAPGERLVDQLGAPAVVCKRHLPGTRYFGCGERTGGLDKTGSRQIFWNIDPPIGHTAALNNLYTSVPFVMAVQDGQAWGLFVDSSGRLEFDLARDVAERSVFAVDEGPLIYYVFAGPTPRAVVERYTELTGRIPMPPLWALGYHQSRWGYKSESEVLEVARMFRRRGLPLDAIYLDIDYMEGYRVFTWDAERFPDPPGLARQLHELGVHLVTIVDPGVKVDAHYSVYTSGRDQDLFCRTFGGSEYHNVVWPGMCAFPDFVNPHARTWWGEQIGKLLDVGVDGVWCDMNEPTVFVPSQETMPADVVHRAEDRAVLHAQVHNLYGQLMARATYEAQTRARPDRRSFVISRSGFAGLQRYALHWTGDNSAWWEHLWMSMPQLQNLGLSGYAWVGVDVGGYAGDATGELLTRWMEFGIFQPFCRNHSAWDTRAQEPWAFGEPYESHIREMLMLRQRLLPYLYTLIEEAHRTGAPILRPLLFDYPDDAATYSADDEFLLGSAILVAPITRPGVEHRHVYVPRGTWGQYWTGERVEGPAHVLVHAPLGRPAVYVRANTPIPMWPAMSFTGERDPDPLTWLVHAAAANPGTGELYADSGDGYAFERGEFSRTRVTCEVTASTVVLAFAAPEGSYPAPHKTVELDVRGLSAAPVEVRVDDKVFADWTFTNAGLQVRLPHTTAARTIEIRAAQRG